MPCFAHSGFSLRVLYARFGKLNTRVLQLCLLAQPRRIRDSVLFCSDALAARVPCLQHDPRESCLTSRVKVCDGYTLPFAVQVPLLNDVQIVEQLRPGSLVRFRCMVQVQKFYEKSSDVGLGCLRSLD